VRQARAFGADPESVTAARKFVVGALARVDEQVRQAAELLVSELATNAVLHVRTDFAVAIDAGFGGTIRIEVTDHGGGTPAMRCPAPDEPTGRGLRIVDMFAETWGVVPHCGGGKTVWFTLARQPPTIRSSGVSASDTRLASPVRPSSR
jgi:anti-sigma regulatory factor (Ser/Thr protein kinase)